MGYYTKYSLKIKTDNPKTDIDEIFTTIKNENAEINGAIDEFGNPYDNTKWYDWLEDMKKISIKYPTIVFILKGEGEESGDLWKAYFKNGKGYKTIAKIFYEEYDESKLE